MSSHRTHHTTRRQFLKHGSMASAAALAAPTFVPASALGKEGRPAPSERIAMGAIGAGGRGSRLIREFLKENGAQLVAVADVDRRHLRSAQEKINKENGDHGCRAYEDFRPLLAREDVDAVTVATPDHWHALVSVAAAEAGKDIYNEKPLANSVVESRAILDAVRRHGRVLQVGSHERSADNTRYACELVRNGYIGKLKTLRVNLPDDQAHHKKARSVEGIPPTMPVPDAFDYNFWLGHTPAAPYTEKRCHFWWRFNLSYGGGEMTDRGAHVIDIAQFGAGKDHTGPVKIKARGERDANSLYDTFWDYHFEGTYADGLKLIGSTDKPRGVKFEGTQGWIFMHIHSNALEAHPESLLKQKIGPNEIHLGRAANHQRNFLNAVRSRTQPLAPAYAGHHTAVICHLNNIAMLTANQTLEWDPRTEQVTNSAPANALLGPTMRKPWSL